jgi:hypothetical protein
MDLPVKYSKIPYKEKRLVREEYIRMQEGKCHYCKSLLSGKPSKKANSKSVKKKYFPKGFFDNPVHLHHSHDTDLTIGAVHAHCNAILWQYHGE